MDLPSKTVIVAEKRSVAADIAKALLGSEARLDDGFFKGTSLNGKLIWVGFAEGHLSRLYNPQEYKASWKDWDLTELPLVPPDGEFLYRPLQSKSIVRLRSAVRSSSEVVNACDAGREGELIFWEIFEGFKDMPVVCTRMWIQATTPMALMEAFESRKPQESKLYHNLLQAALMRQHADWMFGINLSRYATLTQLPGSSVIAVGRVKTPVLFTIHEREEHVRSFQPSRYYRIPIKFTGKDFVEFRGHLLARDDERFGHTPYHFRDFDRTKERQAQVTRYLKDPWRAIDDQNEVPEHPPPPFTLTELQRACAREFGWSAQYTLDVAQVAYLTDKSISYPRTDCAHLPEAMKEDLQSRWVRLVEEHYEFLHGAVPYPTPCTSGVEENGSSELDVLRLEFGRRHFKKRLSGDHHGIIPTGVIPPHEPQTAAEALGMEGAYSLRDSYRLWDLVTRRFLVSVMPSAKIITLSRILITERDNIELRAIFDDAFVKDPGWLLIDDWVDGCACNRKRYSRRFKFPDDFPFLEDFRAYALRATWSEAETEPPEYYNDDSILSFMDRGKLGTSATRAGIITELEKRGYIKREERHYRATPRGSEIMQFIYDKGAFELLTPEMTATWEELLGKVETKGQKIVSYESFLADVLLKVRHIGALFVGKDISDEVVFCPKSNRRVEDHGEFWIFAGFPTTQCRKIILQRQMRAMDYREIFLAGPSGAGPFEGFVSKRTGKEFAAKLVFKPRLNRFDFDFRGVNASAMK
jgi:DNA topoisomerase-3